MTNYEIWQALLADFETKISKANFTTWFKNTGIGKYEEGRVCICVPNNFTKSWLEKKYHSDIIKALEGITGKAVKKVDYKVENIKNIAEMECQIHVEPTVSSPKTPLYTHSKKDLVTKFGLNPKYTFGNFIVGKGNELAHAAAQAVAARPGEAYNPLFIYGDVGLGKTHLIQAIAHEMLKNNPQTRILYVTSEKFTNEFVMGVKEGKLKEFKQRYRNLDLLLIDDIQFIGGKEQTQEEFFHTFNELHQQGKQVVLTSDRPPKDIQSLEDRLRSRFEWGMIADVIAPDLETRVAILESKAQEKKFPLSSDIVQMIARSIESNIRELEGALNKVIAYHKLKDILPSKESVKAVLSNYTENTPQKSITAKELIVVVSEYYDVPREDILGKSREKRLAHPRQVIMYLLREDLKTSFPAIGEELGGRDHTTAMHAYNKIKKALDTDENLKRDVDLLRQKINQKVK